MPRLTLILIGLSLGAPLLARAQPPASETAESADRAEPELDAVPGAGVEVSADLGPEDALRYDALIRRAIAESAAGRWPEARVLFREAHAMNPSARTLRGVGMAAFEISDYVDALRSLRAALLEPRRPLTEVQHAQIVEVIGRAQRFVGEYEFPELPESATLLVDGVPARREPGGTVLLSTGRHRAEIRVGERHVEAAWTIRGGERGPLPIELQAQDPPEGTVAGGEPRPPLSASPEAPRVAPPTESAPLSPTLGWGLGIGGGVMTLIGAGLFALGQWDRAQVEGAAPGTEWSELAGSESRASWASGAGIALVGVGAALAAFGTYLVLRAPDEREPDTGSSELGLAIGAEGLDLLFRGSF